MIEGVPVIALTYINSDTQASGLGEGRGGSSGLGEGGEGRPAGESPGPLGWAWRAVIDGIAKSRTGQSN